MYKKITEFIINNKELINIITSWEQVDEEVLEILIELIHNDLLNDYSAEDLKAVYNDICERTEEYDRELLSGRLNGVIDLLCEI